MGFAGFEKGKGKRLLEQGRKKENDECRKERKK